MLRTSISEAFRERRARLSKVFPKACFIFPANPEFTRNPDVEYPYRQESHFYYLTGFEEAGSFFVMTPNLEKEGLHRSVLFVRDRDPEKEMWEGERYGVERAAKVFGVDEAYSVKELDVKLPELIKGSDRVHFRLGLSESMDRRIITALEAVRKQQGRTGKAMLPVFDPGAILGEMRLIKSGEEIKSIRKSGALSALAHRHVMETLKPGANESEVAALLDYEMIRSGCARVGYPPIVAGGKNATCLHYRANNEPLKDGDLLLIDAGGEFDYFCADITRTFPIGKRFTEPQARIYDLVLKAQKHCIAIAKPGTAFHDLHKKATEVITEGLMTLGLLSGKSADQLIQSGAQRRFFPHGTSHWLGMDVHDVGLYYGPDGQSRLLEPGMILTVEPGIYFQPGDGAVPAEYKNIGVRIEDDILITATGNEVLTADVPKEREEIEALRVKACR